MNQATTQATTARQPWAFALVCAGHALLAWTLLSLSPPGAPQLAHRVQQARAVLVAVTLHAPQPRAHPAPAALTPARPTTPTPRPATAPAHVAAHVAAALAVAPSAEPAAATPVLPEPHAIAPVALARVVAAPITAAAPAASPPSSAAPRASEDAAVARPDHRHCPPATHPAVLRERGIEGAVTLRVKVDTQGRAADALVLAGSGWRLFDEAALQQVRGCRFSPATRGGQAIDSWVEFPVRFALISG